MISQIFKLKWKLNLIWTVARVLLNDSFINYLNNLM